MTSPFTRINAQTIRAERREALARWGHLIAAAVLTLALFALVRAGFLTALAWPDIAARSAALAAW
jgi:hypothetical protein